MAFDCLYLRGRDVRTEPLKDRRKRLEDEIAGSTILPARRLPDDGLEAWAQAQARGYEGLIGKAEMAPYSSATRWYKVKVRCEGRFHVGGMVVTASGYRASSSASVSAASCGTSERWNGAWDGRSWRPSRSMCPFAPAHPLPITGAIAALSGWSREWWSR
jgi:ATP-dependent DNA ligase